MDEQPSSILLKFPGTNCDRETARALETAGFESEILKLSQVEPDEIFNSDLVVFSGGFSFGDYIKAGRLARLEIQAKLGNVLEEFKESGGFLLGICNGFQILLELELLPEGSLITNVSDRFICRWVSLERTNDNSVFFEGIPDTFELPIAHMEGRFVTAESTADKYRNRGLVPLRYGPENPNGSEDRVAGLQDESGRVLGMMPHPERFLYRNDHYSGIWNEDDRWGWGYYFFRSLYKSVHESHSAPSGKTSVETGVS